MKYTIRFTIAFILLAYLSTRSTAQTKLLSDTNEIKDYIEESSIDQYLVIAGTSKDFHALELFAKDLSKKSGVVYDDLGRIYKDSCLVWPDSISDELYRGCYVFRRWETNAITLELNIQGVCYHPYDDKEKPALIIVAGMFSNKKEANERLALIKKYVPTAYLLKKEVYMGCMH